MLHAVSGHSSVWRNRDTPDLAHPQPDPWLQAVNHRVPVSFLACHRALCSPKTGSKTMRLCRRWLSPAASLACSVHSGTTDTLTGISGSQARHACPFLLLPCHHLSLSKSLFHQSLQQYCTYPSNICHLLIPFPAPWVAPLPQNGVRLIPAGRRGNLWTASAALLCGVPPVLGKRWENVR